MVGQIGPVASSTEEGKGMAVRLFQGLASSYDRTADWATLFQDRYWKEWVLERFPDSKGGLALDLGCGTLLLEGRLAGTKGKFIGLDLSKHMLRAGWAKALPNVALLTRGDAERLPFPDESFDAVVSCYVAKYVNTVRFADEIVRVTKPGGAVLVYDFIKPRGPAAPFLELYIRAGLGVFGYLLSVSKRDSAFAFQNLPLIVDDALWDRDFVGIMERRGVQTVNAEELTGGIVFAYCGRKLGSANNRADRMTDPNDTR